MEIDKITGQLERLQGALLVYLEFHTPTSQFVEGLQLQIKDLQDQRDTLRSVRRSEVPIEIQIARKNRDIKDLKAKLEKPSLRTTNKYLHLAKVLMEKLLSVFI